MSCGCGKQISGNVTPIYTLNKVVQNAVDCNITRDQVESLKTTLLFKKNPENSLFVNKSLGIVETMLNTMNYCLETLENLYI